jgi:uncharacterized coiled-coil DUF342 family protein
VEIDESSKELTSIEERRQENERRLQTLQNKHTQYSREREAGLANADKIKSNLRDLEAEYRQLMEQSRQLGEESSELVDRQNQNAEEITVRTLIFLQWPV